MTTILERNFVRLPGLGQAFFELRESSYGPWWDHWTERGEHLFKLGRFHLIYTPRSLLIA